MAQESPTAEKRSIPEEHRVKTYSYVFFGDEQIDSEKVLFGGYLIDRGNLEDLDRTVSSVKRKFGLRPGDPVKWAVENERGFEKAAQLAAGHGEKFASLRRDMLGILQALECVAYVAMWWKPTEEDTSATHAYDMRFVLQRLGILLDRDRKAGRLPKVYPVLDFVVDWFPEPARKNDYFAVYEKCFSKPWRFEKNVIPALSEFGACPSMLVSSCRFSPGLQLADVCVGAVGRFLKSCFDLAQKIPGYVLADFRKVYDVMLKDGGSPLGFGLVAPREETRAKVSKCLRSVGLR